MREIQITQPVYFDSFSCSGPNCSDNCCHSWEILIDKAHYHRYIKETLPEFRGLCREIIEKRKENATADRYARLKLRDDGRCGFQDEDGGCRIYRLLGPEALSCTCSLYPRRKAQFLPDTWEFSLSLSCEEAARLALFSPDSQKLVTFRRPVKEDELLDTQLPFGIGKDGNFAEPPAYGPILRQVCRELVILPELTIRERLLSVGLLLKKTDQLLASSGEAQAAPMAVSFFLSVKQGGFLGFFNQLDYRKDAHLATFRLPMAHLFAGARKPVLRHLFQALEPWCDKDASGELVAGSRAAAFLLKEVKEKADPLICKYEKAVENYFVSYLFSSLFPFLYHGRGFSFEAHAIMLAEQYALLRILLAIYSDISSEEERLIQAVVTLSRLCQHADLAEDMEKLTQAVGLDGLAQAAYLLR